MNWLAQVRHVLGKDVREFRWQLVAYIAIVAIAVIRGVGWAPLSDFMFAMIAVVIAGIIAVASAVQADSPTRSDAFWASHPLRPSAMIGAKVAFALILLAIGLAGQAISIRAFDVEASEILSMLARTIVPYGSWLLIALIVAALARDLRSFVLAIGGTFVASVVVAALISSARPAEPQIEGNTVPAVIAGLAPFAAIGGLCLLVWLYRSRDMRLRTRIAGFGLAALTLPATCASPPDVRGNENPATSERVALGLDHTRGEPLVDGSGLRLILTSAPIPDALRLGFEPETYVVRLRDGSALRIHHQRSIIDLHQLTYRGALIPRDVSVRWINAPIREPLRMHLSVPLTRTERRAVEAGVASVAVEGRVVVWEVQSLATLPLAVGAEVVRDGYRIRMEKWSRDSSDLPVTIQASSIGRSMLGSAFAAVMMESPVRCALINTARGEGLMLVRNGVGTSSDGLVLPGLPLQMDETRYIKLSPSGSSSDSTPDDAWLDGAHLLIATQVFRGSYPVRLELVMP